MNVLGKSFLNFRKKRQKGVKTELFFSDVEELMFLT